MSTAPSPAISPKKHESANKTTEQDGRSFPSRVARGFGHQGILGELQRLVDFERRTLWSRLLDLQAFYVHLLLEDSKQKL